MGCGLVEIVAAVDGLKKFGYRVVGLKAECCTAEGMGCDGGFSAGTPDERVLAFLELCGEINLNAVYKF